MKLIEQYLQVIAQKLPYRGRNDIIAELESLLMDDIEGVYGTGATEDQVKERLKAFGSPSEVARRYAGEKPVIAAGLSEMYFFLLKTVLGALAIAFFVIFILSLLGGPRDAAAVMKSIGNFFTGLFTAYLCATGAITLAFAAVTRFSADPKIDLAGDWDPEELKTVEIGTEQPSKAGSIVTLVCLAAMSIFMNAFPQVIPLAENMYEKTGLPLEHHLSIPIFRIYVLVLTFVWILEAVYHAVILRTGKISERTRIAQLGVNLATIVIQTVMVFDLRLYDSYTGIIGFRLVFIIGAVAGVAGFAATSLKEIFKRLGGLSR